MRHLFALAICACLANPAPAETLLLKSSKAPAPEPEFTVAEAFAITTLLPLAGTLSAWDRIEATLRRFYRDADRDNNGYTILDQDTETLIGAAARRAGIVERWLTMDVTGDFQISEQDLEIIASAPLEVRIGNRMVSMPPTRDQIDYTIQVYKETTRLPDTNRDGVVSLQEILDAASAERPTNREPRFQGVELRMEFDLDGDDIVMLSEYLSITRQVFDRFDKNGDEQIDRVEFSALQDASRETSGLRQ